MNMEREQWMWIEDDIDISDVNVVLLNIDTFMGISSWVSFPEIRRVGRQNT